MPRPLPALPLAALHSERNLKEKATCADRAPGGDVVAGREILHDFDVGGKAGPREHPFEEIMAERASITS